MQINVGFFKVCTVVDVVTTKHDKDSLPTTKQRQNLLTSYDYYYTPITAADVVILYNTANTALYLSKPHTLTTKAQTTFAMSRLHSYIYIQYKRLYTPALALTKRAANHNE